MQSRWFYAVGSIVAAACGGSTAGVGEPIGTVVSTGGAGGESAITGGAFSSGGVATGGVAGTGGYGAVVGLGGSNLGSGGYQTVPGCCQDGCTERCSPGSWRTCGIWTNSDSAWIIQSCRCDGSGWGAAEFHTGAPSVFYMGSGGCPGDGGPGGAGNPSLDSGAAHPADADAASDFDVHTDVSATP